MNERERLQNALDHAENLVRQHRGPEAIVKYRDIINTLVKKRYREPVNAAPVAKPKQLSPDL